MAEKDNLNLIKDAVSLIKKIRTMYNNYHYATSLRNKILCREEYDVEKSMFEKQEDQFALKLNSIESFLEEKDVSLAKREILTAKKLIQRKEYSEQIGIGNSYTMQDYLNEALSQLNNSQ